MTIFASSRNKSNQLEGHNAIIKGLATDGGLYTPLSFSNLHISLDTIDSMSYQDMAIHILSLFFSDYPKKDIEDAVHEAYDHSFSSKEITPVTHIGEDFLLELYHGPTAAFKDVALTLLPRLLSKAYTLESLHKTIYILTATSGDTGKAALEGFKDVPNTKITVFYPEIGVSEIQKRQMVTTGGTNTEVIALQGNFDACQRLVKEAYENQDLNSCNPAVSLSSANSINIGRLAPQIIYYFYSYMQLVKQNKIKKGDLVNFCVPTGNFGDILAGYLAKQMGCPISKLICASNQNNVLTDFLQTGVYNANRSFYTTMSPSMDILVSSNLERLLFILSDYDDSLIASYMKDLKEKGEYTISKDLLLKIQETFIGYYTSEEECKATIQSSFHKDNRLIDPHTSISVHATQVFKKEKINTYPCIILSTASPYKFSRNVLSCLQDEIPTDEFACMEALYKLSSMPIPSSLKDLKELPILHDKCISYEEGIPTIRKNIEEIHND